jgi:F-type H+-transporting ATPase subunit c
MTKKMLFLLALLMVACPVFAQAPGGAAAPASNWWVSIGAGIGMAIASGLCGLGQGKAIAGACEGMARNPGIAPAIQVAMVLGLAFIESLALFTLVIIIIKVA